MIHYISGLFGYFYVCEIYVNLIWYLYLFMLNKSCLSVSLSLSLLSTWLFVMAQPPVALQYSIVVLYPQVQINDRAVPGVAES